MEKGTILYQFTATFDFYSILLSYLGDQPRRKFRAVGCTGKALGGKKGKGEERGGGMEDFRGFEGNKKKIRGGMIKFFLEEFVCSCKLRPDPWMGRKSVFSFLCEAGK